MASTARPQEHPPASAPPANAARADQGTAANNPPERGAPTAKPWRRVVVIGVGVIIAIAALIWGVQAFLFSRAHISTDDAYVQGHLVPVLARVGGYVTQINGDENVHVDEGQTIVVLDSAEYTTKLASAKADLAAAQVAVGMRGYTGQALAQVHTAEGQSAATDAQIGAAQANYDKAMSDLQRVRTLADKQIISRQQLDAAQANADAAHSALIAAQKQAAAAGASVTNAEAGVRLAQARLESARAEVAQAALNLSYTRIVAPVSGILSRKQVELGQLMQAGQTLFTIVADTGVWVDANYKETQLNDIHVGQRVQFDVDAYNGREYNGVVESIAAATGAQFALLPPDNATGNFTKVVQRLPVRIRPTDPVDRNFLLRPGMSVDCHIDKNEQGHQPAAQKR